MSFSDSATKARAVRILDGVDGCFIICNLWSPLCGFKRTAGKWFGRAADRTVGHVERSAQPKVLRCCSSATDSEITTA